MQPLQHSLIRFLREEHLVSVHAVPRQQRRARMRHVSLDVGEQGFGGGSGIGRGCEDCGSEPRATVGVDAPRRHGVEDGAVVVDDGFEASWVEEVEVGVGYVTADLEDGVCLGVETSHL